MKYKLLGLLALLVTPMVTYAQITTLNFQGAVSGTSTYLLNGTSSSADVPSASVTGTFTAMMTIDGSLAANNLTIASYDLAFTGNNGVNGNLGTGFSIDFGSPLPFASGGGTSFVPGGCCGSLDLTTSNGAITGADIFIVSSPYHGNTENFTLGGGGVSFLYELGSASGNCGNLLINAAENGSSTYTGNSINPCSVAATSSTAGVWTVSTTAAPEIDPASAASGLTLLLGGLAVVRGRRKLES